MIKELFFIFSIFLVACGPYKDGGYLMYNGMRQHWNKEDFPVKVIIDTNLTKSQKEDFVDAVEEWNEEVGGDVPVFVIEYKDLSSGEKQPCATMTIQEADIHAPPHDRPEKADAYHTSRLYTKDARFCRGFIYVDYDAESYIYTPLMVHELGHGLGLAHDTDNRFSIMYPTINFFPQDITKEDIKKIIEMKNGQFKQVTSGSENVTIKTSNID